MHAVTVYKFLFRAVSMRRSKGRHTHPTKLTKLLMTLSKFLTALSFVIGSICDM
jgi:hypothetical protein